MSVGRNVVAAIAGVTAEIVITFAVTDRALSFCLFEGLETSDTGEVLLIFAPQNPVPQASVLNQAKARQALLAGLHACVHIRLAIFYALMALPILQHKFYITNQVPESQFTHFPSSPFCRQPRIEI